MYTVVSHPSVRIKGTEDYFEPTPCQNVNCVKRAPHMHCPFCVSTESYHDPVILKAHYRVKHVDKGIDYAGLKILRCCDHCDIVGTIKGMKEFKGAHWHCYKCRNGFNRRDEALKHYRTHFRNPQTTFQIQVQTEVTGSNEQASQEASEAVDGITQEMTAIHSPFHETVITSTVDNMMGTTLGSPVSPGSSEDGGDGPSGKEVGVVHVAVAANETVGTSPIIVLPQVQQGSDAEYTGQADLQQPGMASEADDEEDAVQVEAFTGGAYTLRAPTGECWEEERSQLVLKLAAMSKKMKQAGEDKRKLQQQLQAQMLATEQLQQQNQQQEKDVEMYRKREQDLVSLSDDKVAQMLGQMRAEHENLLQSQLVKLRRISRQPAAAAGSITTQQQQQQQPAHVQIITADSTTNIQTVLGTPMSSGTILVPMDGTTYTSAAAPHTTTYSMSMGPCDSKQHATTIRTIPITSNMHLDQGQVYLEPVNHRHHQVHGLGPNMHTITVPSSTFQEVFSQAVAGSGGDRVLVTDMGDMDMVQVEEHVDQTMEQAEIITTMECDPALQEVEVQVTGEEEEEEELEEQEEEEQQQEVVLAAPQTVTYSQEDVKQNNISLLSTASEILSAGGVLRTDNRKRKFQYLEVPHETHVEVVVKQQKS